MNYGHGGPDPRVDGQSLIEDLLLLDKVQAASGLFQRVCLQGGVLETGRDCLLHGLLIGLGPHKGGGLALISASRVHHTPVKAPLEGGWRSGMLG